MTPLTIGLIALAGLLFVANALVSVLPKRGKVSVAFIPPAPETPSVDPANVGVKLDAHIQSTNHKITALFSRVELLEKAVQGLVDNNAPVRDQTWLQTAPIRAGKKSAKR